MSSVDRIEALLRELHEALATLRAAQEQGLEVILADPLRRAGVHHLCETAVQACVDMADEILALEDIEEPARQRDVFPALAGVGLIEADLAATLADLVGFRDMLVHRYAEVTPQLVAERVPQVAAAATRFAVCALAPRAGSEPPTVNRSPGEWHGPGLR